MRQNPTMKQRNIMAPVKKTLYDSNLFIFKISLTLDDNVENIRQK